ncbi:MAG: type II toxin-antitoxin system Phd/YefM family antitoxin [Pseudomonadota bacterium]
MASIINVHEAKTNLSRLVAGALAGEEVVLAKGGRPLVRLVPVEPRVPGKWKGRVRMARDFDRLPKAVLDAFEGKAR